LLSIACDHINIVTLKDTVKLAQYGSVIDVFETLGRIAEFKIFYEFIVPKNNIRSLNLENKVRITKQCVEWWSYEFDYILIEGTFEKGYGHVDQQYAINKGFTTQYLHKANSKKRF